MLISQPLHWVSFVVEHFQKLSLSYQSFQKTISVGIIALYLFAIANATSQLEHENVPGVVESLKVVTEKNTERLCRFAFDYARENGRKKVTVVHKAVRRYIICLCLILFYNHIDKTNISEIDIHFRI